MIDAVEVLLHTCLIAKHYTKEYLEFRITGYHIDAHGVNFHVQGGTWASTSKESMLGEIMQRNLRWLFGATHAGIRHDTGDILIARDMKYGPDSNHVQALIKMIKRYIAGSQRCKIEHELWDIGLDMSGYSNKGDYLYHLEQIRNRKTGSIPNPQHGNWSSARITMQPINHQSMRVDITAPLIARSIPGSADGCVVARAMREAFPGEEFRFNNHQLFFKGSDERLTVPSELSEIGRRFDAGQPVTPVSFYITR